jgi:uncharacterized protein
MTACAEQNEYATAVATTLDRMEPWMRRVESGFEVDVWVVPGSSRDSVDGPHGDALKVRVTASPDKGRANEAVAEILSTHFEAPVTLLRGHTSRRKTFLVFSGAEQNDG